MAEIVRVDVRPCRFMLNDVPTSYTIANRIVFKIIRFPFDSLYLLAYDMYNGLYMPIKNDTFNKYRLNNLKLEKGFFKNQLLIN